MLILPPGHAQAVGAPRTLRPRERRLIAGVLSTVAALAAVLVVAFATGGHSTGNGCIDVNVQSSLGSQEFYRCGAAARSMCGNVGVPGGFVGVVGHAVATECRKAGLPVG